MGGVWTWIVQFKTHSGHQLEQALPWLFAAAYLADTFSYTTMSTEPPSKDTTYSLFERATYSWVDAIVRRNANIELDDLPRVALQPNFDSIQMNFVDTCASSKTPTWGLFYAFLLRNYRADMLKAAVLRLAADLSTVGIPWLLRLILVDPTVVSIALLFGMSTTGAIAAKQDAPFD
ncbi:hypothetical protein ACHAPT_009485 [Fusarium lateritium]